MRFKISVDDKPSHKGAVTSIGWSSTEEFYSTGDDGQLLCWSVSNNTPTKIASLPEESYPTDLQFLARVTSGNVGKHSDLMLVTTATGKFLIMNRSGRIERAIEAHKGAVLVGQWGHDGASFFTGGEDGFLKIWSRSGMLRSTVVSSETSIYDASWSPDGQSIAYTQGKCIVIKQLAPNTKPLKWKAHEGLVLCLAWSPASELIASGGEDCKYRVWDSLARPIFSSILHNNHITSISWSPNGDLFAVGSYNTLRLCDHLGWSRSLEKPQTGTIYKMSWSADGTQLAAACANGHVLFAHVIERHVHYQNFTASITERKVVTVTNVRDDTVEHLEHPERVIHIALKYSHLVLTTPTQCYIYNTKNWNTPAIFDLKDGAVLLILQAEPHFLLVEKNNVGLYNYQGRLVASPRWPNMRLDGLRNGQISLSPDAIVIRDSINAKVVYVFDINSNRSASAETVVTLTHSMNVLQVALEQWGPQGARQMALLDKARDLYIVPIKATNKSFNLLGRKIESFLWNTEENIIAAIQDTQLIVWYCPSATFNAGLLKICSFYYDAAELGKSPRISDFVGNSVSIRRADGSLINVPISPFPALLHRHIQDNKWENALQLCRSLNDKTLWACLAVLATQSNGETIEIAEEAYANINNHDKVFYIQHIKSLPTKAQQKAGMALLGGKVQDAESILLHNGLVFLAIYNNIQLHNWNRALDLALKHKTHIDTVLYMRQEYLKTLGKSENNNKFVSINDNVQFDAVKVKQKIDLELNKIKDVS